MLSVVNGSETARIEALLTRLDPHQDGVCTVPGCVHRGAPSADEQAPPLAA